MLSMSGGNAMTNNFSNGDLGVASPYYSPNPVMRHDDMHISTPASGPAIILGEQTNYKASEVIDESLSIEDKEKELILRALKNIKAKEKMLPMI